MFHANFLFGLYFDPEDGGDIFAPKHLLISNGLHGVVTKRIKIFITIAVITPYLTDDILSFLSMIMTMWTKRDSLSLCVLRHFMWCVLMLTLLPVHYLVL
jgi:hypothetical protein